MESGFKQIAAGNLKVAFLLLCHGKVANIKKLLSIEYFNHPNIKIYIHYDKKQSVNTVNDLKAFIKSKNNLHFVEKRVSCGWGEYSLVEATLNMMEVAVNDSNFEADYLFLMSAACHPIAPFSQLTDFLSAYYGKEFIEANDHRYVKWIEGGWDKERTWYYFPFNYYTERDMYQYFCDLQEKKGIRRELPIEMSLNFGSQWCCLTKQTCLGILKIMSNPKLVEFFRYCWIPDEFLIQSLAVKVAGITNVTNRNLTFYQFNSFGRPLVICNDHQDFVDKLNYFFVRKVSKHAEAIKQYLIEISHPDYKPTKSITLENVGIRPKDFVKKQKKYTNYKKQTRLGRIEDAWNEGISRNTKQYHVLTGPCKYILQKLVDEACKYENLTVFSFLFNNKACIPSSQHDSYKGISKNDLHRRNVDNVAFLNEVIHADVNEVCFAFDTDEDSDHVREVMRWDKYANIMIVEPHWRNDTERAVSYLTEDEAELLLDYDMAEIEEEMHKIIRKKRKYYWQGLKKNGKHKAAINWLEDSEGYFSYRFIELKNKYFQHTYWPEANIKLYSLMMNSKLKI